MKDKTAKNTKNFYLTNTYICNKIDNYRNNLNKQIKQMIYVKI